MQFPKDPNGVQLVSPAATPRETHPTPIRRPQRGRTRQPGGSVVQGDRQIQITVPPQPAFIYRNGL
ncbi:MAG: hypothetical protein JJU29_18810 [Verrucomicrobia bacterium]|nr:hypothetical protein [Verrucomicrobiota bacterium]MCH8514087.1 hypothetical protein [Kiritimatiellia bacterium]